MADDFHCGHCTTSAIFSALREASALDINIDYNGAADARILAEPAPHDSEMHALLAFMVIQADWRIAGTHPARSELRTLREGSDAFDPMVL
jgi:hypothetical protein